MSADEDAASEADDAPNRYPYFQIHGSTLGGLSAEAGYVNAQGEVESKVVDSIGSDSEGFPGVTAADAQQAFNLVFGWYANRLETMARDGGEEADG